MHETSKALLRRLHDSRYATRYFVGHGLDIGAGPDMLAQYAEQFPLMRSCRAWDLQDGDAQLLSTIPDESLDFAHSSHCLEHMRDPREALNHWLRILKPRGHLVVTVPDEDLYEQGGIPVHVQWRSQVDFHHVQGEQLVAEVGQSDGAARAIRRPRPNHQGRANRRRVPLQPGTL